MANKSDKRGHWTKGKHRNQLSPYQLRKMDELREWVANNNKGPGIPNPYSVKRMAADLGIANSTLRRYLHDGFSPNPLTYRDIMRWWEKAILSKGNSDPKKSPIHP